MMYASPDASKRAQSREIFERLVAEAGQKVIGWRDVPTDNSIVGEYGEGERAVCAAGIYC